MEPFSVTVKARRKTLGLTRQEVGTRTGATEREVGFWETGDRTPEPDRQSEILQAMERPVTVVALANQLKREAAALIDRYASQMERAAASSLTPDPRPVAEAFGKAKGAGAAPAHQRERKAQ